jgi:hypothetical protein
MASLLVIRRSVSKNVLCDMSNLIKSKINRMKILPRSRTLLNRSKIGFSSLFVGYYILNNNQSHCAAKKEDDDNYIIENYRPLKEGDIRKLSKPILDKFVDRLLVNPLQVKFLYSTNAKSEIKLVNKANIANKKNLSLDKKKVSLCGAKDLRKMREKYEVINIVKGEVENKKKREQDENSVKAKKNEEFSKTQVSF